MFDFKPLTNLENGLADRSQVIETWAYQITPTFEVLVWKF